MELKTARLTLLIDPNKKAAFERLCAQRDLTASQVVRQLIRDYLAAHGVDERPGMEPVAPTAARRTCARRTRGARDKTGPAAATKAAGARRKA